MKIMTFNTQHCLNYIERKIDFRLMADTIVNFGAELIGLNEMRGKGENAEYDRQTEILSELTGIGHYYFAKAIDVPNMGPYGNALLSKIPVVSAETVPIPDPVPKEGFRSYETRCVLKVKLENGLTVLVTHFGLNPDEQENAVKTVLDVLEDEKCVLMGDFNVEPDNEVLLPIRARMRDAAEKLSTPKLSFPSDEPKIKIDYIFTTPDVEIVYADIPATVASDHRPHIAEIRF
ncbi:MAG: endonuclease/exonuclease/phosphatase family protein [Clostridia bacterium]|nr:endonuclease/exonuclease/phosphatase family protein [Clostridia bacterium]